MVHKLDPDLEKRSARAIDACKAQWFAMGLQGTTWWAWNDGLSSDIDSYRPSVRDSLTPEREALRKWLWLQARGPTANPAKVAVVRNAIIGHSEERMAPLRATGQLRLPMDIKNHDNSSFLGLNPKHWARPGLYTRRPWDFEVELAPVAQARTLRVAITGESSTVFDFKQGEEYTFLKNDQMPQAAAAADVAEAPRGPRVVAEFTQAAGEPLRASGRLGFLTNGLREMILVDEAGGEISLLSGRVHDATAPHNAIMAYLYGITEALLDLNVHPFDVITLENLAANPDLPARYDAILLDTRNLPAGFALEGPAFRFDAKINAPALRAFLAERGVNTSEPGPLLVARNAHGLMVYNRGQTPYTGSIRPELPEGIAALADFDQADAITPRGQTLHIGLEPYAAKVFQFVPSPAAP